MEQQLKVQSWKGTGLVADPRAAGGTIQVLEGCGGCITCAFAFAFVCSAGFWKVDCTLCYEIGSPWGDLLASS